MEKHTQAKQPNAIRSACTASAQTDMSARYGDLKRFKKLVHINAQSCFTFYFKFI
jgi:hypothetical protein